jgi:hypothetical protein
MKQILILGGGGFIGGHLGKRLKADGFKCPEGVRGRNSDNDLYREKIGWEVNESLMTGMIKTYNWINKQVNDNI